MSRLPARYFPKLQQVTTLLDMNQRIEIRESREAFEWLSEEFQGVSTAKSRTTWALTPWLA